MIGSPRELEGKPCPEELSNTENKRANLKKNQEPVTP